MNAPIQPGYTYRAHAESVHDGDTYRLRVDLGFYVAVSVPVRLRAVDSPELNTIEGKAARDYAGELLNVYDGDEPAQLLVTTYRTRGGSFEMSFARWLADVWILPTDLPAPVSMADALVAAGHATYREGNR